MTQSLLGFGDRRPRSFQLLLKLTEPLLLLGRRVTEEFGLGSVGNLCVGPGLVGRGYRVPRGVQIPGQVRSSLLVPGGLGTERFSLDGSVISGSELVIEPALGFGERGSGGFCLGSDGGELAG